MHKGKQSNENLNKAKAAKNDEFYTRLEDIEKELEHYTEHFKGKVVYCNCDDANRSNFFKYFSTNFQKLGLKKLITSGLKIDGTKDGTDGTDGTGVVAIQKGDDIDIYDGNGDFRSEECIEFLKEADIVVTNPPFSCYSDDTEVLTDEGWKFFKDVRGSEKIFSLNPFTKETSYTSIVRKYEKKVDEELYYFKKRGIDLMVTGNHRMLVNQANDKILTADKIKGEYHTLPIRGFNYKNTTDITTFTLPKTKQLEKYSRKEIEVEEKTIGLNEWLEFFGFWIADGYTRNHINVNGNRDYTIGIKQNLNNSEYTERLFFQIGFPCKIYKDKNKANFCVYSKQLWEYLVQFGGSTTKYVPRWILNLPKENLQYFLNGYLNGDSNGDDAQFRIGSVSKQLCSDLAEIILKVDGRIVNFIPKKTKGNRYYQASYSKQNLSRENIKYPKAERIKYDRNVYCLELEENHIMLVRRNGTVVWCGNCFREYVAQLMQYGKKFLIIGSMNAITYKEIFPYIKNNELWLGITSVKDFIQPNGEIKKFGNICWFTNLEHSKRNEELILYKHYNPTEYPKYDNADAIEVSKVAEIPMDYEGVMGVPISFLDKYCPNQFEIIGIANSARYIGDFPCLTIIDGKRMYSRILIQKII